MNYFFYLDYGIQIGNGHYVRCLNIAKKLKQLNHNVYLVTSTQENLPNNIWNILYVKKNSITDVVEISNQFYKEESIFILDHYYIENHIEFEKTISKYFSKFVVIEDLNNRRHYCDVFINWNIYASKTEYQRLMLKKNTKILCGIKYFLINDDFLKTPKDMKKNTIFVFFTSGNDKNLTLITLNALSKFNFNIECVIGNVNPSKNKIIEYCKQNKNINLHIQTQKIHEIMSKCEFAIGSFGQNTYERLYYKIPTIGIEIADNQKLIGEYCKNNNLAINLGWWQNVSANDIINALDRIVFFKINFINFNKVNELLESI